MHTRNVTIGSQTISFETGKLAKQADGSVIVRLGDTMVLVTACYAANPREGIDFLPLTVDYREYTYASGRIPGGFFKREGKPSEKEVLTSRMTDRPIRPLFPPGWRHETQVIALVLSADSENDSDVLAITGASAALAISEIPFQKTIASVRVGLVDGQFIINPTYPQRRQSRLDLIVAGSRDGIVMVEAGAKEATEEEVVQALDTAQAAIRQIVDAIDDLAKEIGKKKREVAEEGSLARVLPRGRGEGARPAQRGDAHPRQARELRPRRRGPRGADCVAARRRGPAEGRSEVDLQGAQGEGAARRGARARRPARWPEVRRDPRRSGARSGCCPACTGRRCSRAARRRRSSPPRSAPPTISRRSRPSTATATSASCSTTTSRRSRSARWRSCAAPDAAKWATARSPSGPSRRSCPAKTSSPTPSAWCPTSSSRTDPRRWRRSAAARWR